MEPNIWGAGAWLFLHSITLNYPDNPTLEDKKRYSDFFDRLGYVLPCEICKKHYSKNIKDEPINFSLNSKESLTKWLLNIHNKVNVMYNKPVIDYKAFLKLYKDIYRNKEESITYYKNKNSIQKRLIAVLIFIIIMLVGIIVFPRFYYRSY